MLMKSRILKNVNKYWQSRLTTRRFWWMLLFLFSGLGIAQIAPAASSNLTVKLTDSTANIVLANKKLVAYERGIDGKLSWQMEQITDSRGVASFDLTGLGKGKAYVLKVSPYSTAWVSSIDIQSPGTFDFRVGRVDLTAINGATGSKLQNAKITVYERLADGSRHWYSKFVTNSNGFARIALPALGQGRTFLFGAASSVDKKQKFSSDINKGGSFRFVVGNKPLTVTLVNGVSGHPLADMAVPVLGKLADGGSQWVGQKATDMDGKIVFDLEGLGTGRKYFLRTKPYGSWVDSSVISQPGNFTFKVGTFEVSVVNGASEAALANAEIFAIERLPDGSRKWRYRKKADDQGIVRFDLPGLGSGRVYQLAAYSPSDNSIKFSAELTRTGRFNFVVGNNPLTVKLVNAISGQPLVNMGVQAREQLADGGNRLIAQKTTDVHGEIIADLEGLGVGRKYFLRTKPYGAWVDSRVIDQPGNFTFKVGQLAVTLRDADTGKDLPGHKLTLLEKGQNGNLTWRGQGISDLSGTVRFDPLGLGQAKVFTVRAINVFGKGKNYFAPWITTGGAVNLAISKQGDYSLDMNPPSVVIDSPQENGIVSHAGFSLRGRVTDKQSISNITISVISPTQGTRQTTVLSKDGNWELAVKKSMIAPGERLRINVSAFDRMRNVSAANRILRVVQDTEAPIVTITSPKNWASVSAASFVVTGTATDNTRIEQMLASVYDPVLGPIINQRRLQLNGDDGNWGLPIDNVISGRKLTIVLVAKDLAGNVGRGRIIVNPTENVLNPHQLINRITFGATPVLLDEIDAVGADAFLRSQLNPQTIDDSDLETMIAKLGIPQRVSDFQSQQLVHGTHSKRQLLEVMTAFWENHFNTELRKSGLPVERAENKNFRQNALGYFRDLLLTSATSPAMLRYLDGVSNRHEEPNENYARELLELHTLGVNGGYADSDVIEAARVFTGWKVKNNAFHFSTWDHDYEEKTVLGHKFLPGGGVEEGMQLLEMLAGHPSTARFVCKKLITLLLTDTPSETYIENCAGGFLASDGHIGYVLELILRSPDFSAPENFHNKVKTPLEFVAGLIRNFQAKPGKWDNHRALRSMGAEMFNYDDPTGYDEDGISWLNSHQLLQRILFANKVATNPARDYATHILPPSELFLERGLTGAGEIVDYLFELALAGDFSPAGRQEALAILTDDGMNNFNIHDPDADQRLRKLIGGVMSYPEYQLQ